MSEQIKSEKPEDESKKPLAPKDKRRRLFPDNTKHYEWRLSSWGANHLGPGTPIDEGLYQFFVANIDTLGRRDNTPEERQAIVHSVLEKITGHELSVMGHNLGCEILELLLPHASPKELERYMDIVSADIERSCCNDYAFSVIETLQKEACHRATEHLQVTATEGVPKKKSKMHLSYPHSHVQKCHNFTLKLCNYSFDNFDGFVFHRFGVRMLCRSVKCLSGIFLLPGQVPKFDFIKAVVPEKKKTLNVQTELQCRVVPFEFKEIVTKFIQQLMQWPHFKILPFDDYGFQLLTVVLYATKNLDQNFTNALITELLNECFVPDDDIAIILKEREKKLDPNEEMKEGRLVEMYKKCQRVLNQKDLPRSFYSMSALRVLEVAMYVADQKTFWEIYSRCFSHKLRELATFSSMSMVLRRLFQNCRSKEQFEAIFDKMGDLMPALLLNFNSAVLVAMASACARFNTRQEVFLQRLESIFKCTGLEQHYLGVCCIKLTPLNRIDLSKLDKDYYIQHTGCQLLQTLIVEFQQRERVIQSFLQMTPAQLMVLLPSARVEIVTDALCAKAADRIVDKMKGHLEQLALTAYGARTLHRMFNSASFDTRLKIMSELSESALDGSDFAKAVSQSLDVAGFKKNRKQWERTWRKKESVPVDPVPGL